MTQNPDWMFKARPGLRSAPKVTRLPEVMSKGMRLAPVALAMGLAMSLAPTARIAAAADTGPSTPNPTITALHDPQPGGVGPGTFPPLGGPTEDSSLAPPPRVDSANADASPREPVDSPMAPLPPAVVAGPIGIALAGWMARRANRRGGRV